MGLGLLNSEAVWGLGFERLALEGQWLFGRRLKVLEIGEKNAELN